MDWDEPEDEWDASADEDGGPVLEPCDGCGRMMELGSLYEGDGPLLGVAPDSSAVYELNLTKDGKRTGPGQTGPAPGPGRERAEETSTCLHPGHRCPAVPAMTCTGADSVHGSGPTPCSHDDRRPQQPAPRRGKILDALARVERKVFTRPAPDMRKGSGEIPPHAGKGLRQGPGGAPRRLAPDCC